MVGLGDSTRMFNCTFPNWCGERIVYFIKMISILNLGLSAI